MVKPSVISTDQSMAVVQAQPKPIARPEAKAKPAIVKSKHGVKPEMPKQEMISKKATIAASPVIPPELQGVAFEDTRGDQPDSQASPQQEGDVQDLPKTTLSRFSQKPVGVSQIILSREESAQQPKGRLHIIPRHSNNTGLRSGSPSSGLRGNIMVTRGVTSEQTRMSSGTLETPFPLTEGEC